MKTNQPSVLCHAAEYRERVMNEDERVKDGHAHSVTLAGHQVMPRTHKKLWIPCIETQKVFLPPQVGRSTQTAGLTSAKLAEHN